MTIWWTKLIINSSENDRNLMTMAIDDVIDRGWYDSLAGDMVYSIVKMDNLRNSWQVLISMKWKIQTFLLSG